MALEGAYFMYLNVTFQNVLVNKGHFRDHESFWLWKTPPPFTAMTLHEPATGEQGDGGTSRAGKLQGPRLPVLIFLLFSLHLRDYYGLNFPPKTQGET